MIDLLDEHRHYVTDARRLEAYRRALAATIRPGDTVLDLGAGTGVLGLLACEAGAGRVYAVDDGPALDLARAIARAGPYANRVVHVRGHSAWVRLPEPVDVIVADQVGYFGPEVGFGDDVPVAATRFLGPGGRVVPGAIRLFAAPVSLPEVRRRMDAWLDVPGVDLSLAVALERDTARPVSAPAAALLSAGVDVGRVDARPEAPSTFVGAGTVTCERTGTADGILGWFEATLAPGITMTNAPGAPDRIDRAQLFMPTEGLAVRAGDRLAIRVHVTPVVGVVAWTLEVNDHQGRTRERRQQTVIDALLRSAPEVARRTAPSHCPVLGPAGQARLEVLRLCDGRHSVADIERVLRMRFPDAFPTPDAVAAFVAGVLRAYAT